MLTIPFEVITDLLGKAAEVEVSVFELSGEELPDEDGVDDEDLLEDGPALRALAEAIGALTPEALQEMLTLARLGDEDTEAATWDAAAAEARSIPEPDRIDELVRALVLTDAIETALEDLGFEFEDDEDDDADADEED